MPTVRKIEDRGVSGTQPLRVTTRVGHYVGKSKQWPRLLVRCGCCEKRLVIAFEEPSGNPHHDALEIEGVLASVDQWRQLLGPLIGLDEQGNVVRALLEHHVQGSPTMSLNASKGSRVVFALLKHHGLDIDRERALAHLTVGQIYTVDRMRVGKASSDVYLKEVPGISFNPVLFLDAPS